MKAGSQQNAFISYVPTPIGNEVGAEGAALQAEGEGPHDGP